MKYLRRHNVNPQSFLDNTILQKTDGNIELNPTSDVLINGNLVFGPGAAIPGPNVTNVMYVTLDGNDTNDGFGEGPNQAKRTLKAACAVAQQGTTIFVRSGEYEEDNPIRVPPRVSIVGDNLRTTIIRPLNNTITYSITNVSRIDGLVTVTTATNHGLDSSSRVRVDCDTESDVNDTDANVIDVPTPTTFRYKDYGSNIASAAATGTVKRGFDLFHLNSADYITQLVIKGLQAPAYCVSIDSDAFVDTSPYVQNCSNINGPWLRNGVEWLPFQTAQPDINGVMTTGPRPLLDDEIDPAQVAQYGVDIEGAGGGMLIDGDKYNSESPIKSMIGDAFTMVAQGGIGFHITNFGYMQLVSCFAVFCSKGFYTTKGGYLSISNSVCDFGTIAFEADGFYPIPYASGLITADYYSTVASVSIDIEGAGYTSAPVVTIDPPTTPGGVQATATAVIDAILQKVVAITVINAGSGYDFQPAVSFSGGGTPTVIVVATANLSSNLTLPVSQISNKPQIGSIMFLGNDPTGYYISATSSPLLTFVYDEQQYRRDIALILDSVLGDMVLNSNHQSVYAGLALSQVSALQKTQTLAGINKAKIDTLALGAVVGNATAVSRISTLFDAVLDIVNLGSIAAPAISVPNTVPREPGFAEAADLLIANKLFLQEEIAAWIALNYPALVYNVVTCQRDIEYIIDALAFDLKYEGNSQTKNAALAYGSGAVIAGQVEETQDAYEYWQTIIGRIVKSQPIPVTAGNAVSQVTGSIGAPVDPNGPATTAEQLLGIVIDVIDHGTGYVPELTVFPKYENGDAALLSVRAATYPQIITIQDNVIDFLNTTYGGSITVTTFPPVQAVTAGTQALFHNVSTISTASTALEYVGAGVTYNALPFYGGEPVPANERVEINSGKCFTVTSDQVGNYRIGQFFAVNAITGGVTLDAENIDLQGIGAIGPLKRNGIPVGVSLQEISNSTSLLASTGGQDINTVPTQFAVATYVQNNYLNKVQGTTQTVAGPLAFTADIQVNSGNLYSTAAIFNLLNRDDGSTIIDDGPTTVNAFLAATTIEIGAATGTLTINNNKVIINSTASLQIPVGDISQRPSPALPGQIRYNNEISTFEGYGPGGAWGSLGGVRSVDGLTQITAESAAGVSDDILRFFAADVDNISSKLVATLNNTSLTVLNSTESTDKDTGALVVEGGAGIEKNLNVGGNTVITGDLAVNGGDITTSAATFNLANANATTVNFAGAATDIQIGAATGTTNINNNLDVDGDVNIDGGDLTVSTATFNLSNTTATTINAFGAATDIQIGAATGTTNINNNLDVDGDVNFDGGNITSNAVTVNILAATSTTVNAFGAATALNLGAATGTTVVKNNVDVDLNTVLHGTLTVDLDATVTGDLAVNGGDITTSAATFNLANATATTVNFAGAATALEIGAATGTTSINNDLDVDGDVNIDGGDLTVSTTTFNLANANATTVNFAGAAATINIGAAGSAGTFTIKNDNVVLDGDLQIKGGDLTTDQSTFNLANATATTVNFAGAATALEIGAATGTTNINNDLDVDGDVNIDGGDLTVSTTTFNLANTTATTVNFAGAATDIQIGAATGTTNINNDLDVDGDVNIDGGDLTVSTTTFNLANTTATTVNFAGAATDIQIGAATGTTNINNDLDVDGDVNIDGGDLTVSTATFNLANTNATTVNFAGAATALEIGAATGTTNINNDLDVDGDVNIDGGDLTVSTTTFNLANTTSTTGNLFGVATGVNVGISAAAASTLTYGPAITGNTFKLAGTTIGTVNYTTDVTSGIVNAWQSVTGTVNLGKSGTINIGNSTTDITSAVVGGAFSGNSLKIAGTSAGTITLNSDVTTGSVNLFDNITTGTVNIAGAGTNTINLGSTTSTVNIGVLALTTDLTVQHGGTGRSTFAVNGIIYGNTADGLLVTAASLPGSNATTSFGILTTDAGNVPVWTDTIDGGSY